MVDPDDAPTPALAERFLLEVAVTTPIVVGTLATGGVREYHAACDGRLHGEGLEGTVIGGGETLLRRPDGIGVLEANFLVQTADGAILRIIGTGYRTQEGPFTGTRMTIVFEVDEAGPHAPLSTRAYVAERPSGSDRYTIAEIV
ncbi:MAG TPA: DUF3237 family protein [Sphingomonadaceae bacterium]|nr:DUF3237 family protein [Sphingomonadaceae bacterium]